MLIYSSQVTNVNFYDISFPQQYRDLYPYRIINNECKSNVHVRLIYLFILILTEINTFCKKEKHWENIMDLSTP